MSPEDLLAIYDAVDKEFDIPLEERLAKFALPKPPSALAEAYYQLGMAYKKLGESE